MATIQSTQPVRIAGYEPLVGSTMRGRAALSIGLLLSAITGGLLWVAWGDLPSGVERPNVSPELFSMFVLGPFGAPGFFLTLLGILDVRRDARVRNERQVYPSEPWRWDFRWRGPEVSDIGLKQASRGLFALLLAVGVIGPVGYFAFTAEAPWSARMVVGIFAVLLSLSLGTVVYRFAAQLIHGRSRLRFDRFPLRLGEPIELTLVPSGSLADVRDLRFTLRCVKEQFEKRRTTGAGHQNGSHTTTTTIAFERHHDEATVERPDFAASQAIHVSFQLPDVPELATHLSHDPPQYWELSVVGERPGVDFQKRFVLPVY